MATKKLNKNQQQLLLGCEPGCGTEVFPAEVQTARALERRGLINVEELKSAGWTHREARLTPEGERAREELKR